MKHYLIFKKKSFLTSNFWGQHHLSGGCRNQRWQWWWWYQKSVTGISRLLPANSFLAAWIENNQWFETFCLLHLRCDFDSYSLLEFRLPDNQLGMEDFDALVVPRPKRTCQLQDKDQWSVCWSPPTVDRPSLHTVAVKDGLDVAAKTDHDAKRPQEVTWYQTMGLWHTLIFS